ncbi:PQQ-binding-like beta-propeller repeat protein [Micromonospora halotolerans]|uniref:PQQ-binding-like beta-propeller repeat protein n=1 Tax=Micromonospora halotolerans TaxID=709879 RepID=A0ABY9ZYL1_9ACTN|nr:PQQ-binding-like beta-propeller repeat protein [Micromonospora halotolerans]WNM40396.1 PQQ-binding-like beta-propeller repeat protein [Micromonospora halotolerans]
MAVIDLGELHDDTAPGPPARRPRAVGRPFRSVVVLLVALVTLAAAAPPSRPAARTLPGGPAAAAFVSGDRVYVVRPPDPQRGVGRQLVAYRVAGGPPRTLWRTLVPGTGVATTVWEQDGTVLLVGRTAGDSGWETIGLDARTGRVSWLQPGVGFPAGGALLLQVPEMAGREAVRRVAVSDGRTLWSVPGTPDNVELSFGPSGVDRLVHLPPAGETVVYDAADGSRLAARDLAPGDRPTRRWTLLGAGMLLVIKEDGGSVTAYDLDTLQRRWTAVLPLVGFAERCGSLLCAVRLTGGMWALDPATGAVRWTDDRWTGTLAATGGRLLVGVDTASGSALAVVEEATGRLVADLGVWGVVPQDEFEGRLFGVRRTEGGRLLLAELDPARGSPEVREVLVGAVGDCRMGAELLVCRRADGGFGLWRLP